jgi:hypothetical protein
MRDMAVGKVNASFGVAKVVDCILNKGTVYEFFYVNPAKLKNCTTCSRRVYDSYFLRGVVYSK